MQSLNYQSKNKAEVNIMSEEIKNLEPKEVWENFYLLTQCPRPSNHEEKAREAVMNWAKERNFDAEIDETGNIIIRKAATPGMEDRMGCILQGHLDMVPQKNNDTVHDFEKDPIDAYVEGEWVTARGTTLGADNGMGVAAGMALLESTDIPHGPIEVLITATEETGMDGAENLKPGVLKGDILLNLDSETEGELYVGCAGGIDGNFTFNYKNVDVPAGVKACNVEIKGLKGGHSGMDIILGRGNSNKLLFRFIKKAYRELGARLVSVNGGSLRNAIPRESMATVVVPEANVEAFVALKEEFEAIFKSEFKAVEPDLEFKLEACDTPAQMIEEKVQLNLINAVLACPNGVMRMSDAMENLVETSNNLAFVESKDGVITISCLLRSAVDSAKLALVEVMTSVFEMAQADTIDFTGEYPGWQPNMESPILKTMQETYNKMFGSVPEIKAIHAGLECGLLGHTYPNWDMISFGPTIQSPHSPDERVNIASVGKFWDFFKETLKNVPTK